MSDHEHHVKQLERRLILVEKLVWELVGALNIKLEAKDKALQELASDNLHDHDYKTIAIQALDQSPFTRCAWKEKNMHDRARELFDERND